MKNLLCIGLLLVSIQMVAQENGSRGIYSLATEILQKYDVNGDGRLDVQAESFLRKEIGDSDGKTVTHVQSRGLLFSDADGQGDNNGWASLQELEAILGGFDKNGDGELEYPGWLALLFGAENEWQAFAEKYGERFSYK